MNWTNAQYSEMHSLIVFNDNHIGFVSAKYQHTNINSFLKKLKHWFIQEQAFFNKWFIHLVVF